MKKAGLIGVVLVLCALMAAGMWNIYEGKYSILPDHSNLVQKLDERAVKNSRSPEDLIQVLAIHDAVTLGEDQVVLMEVQGKWSEPMLGMVELERGINGNYRIGWMTYGTEKISRDVMEVDGTAYYLAAGYNPDCVIRRHTFAYNRENEEISVEIPEKEQFLIAFPVEPGLDYDPALVRYYNAAGEDITQMIWDSI